MNISLVGAGLSCAIIGNKLAKAGHKITIFESRSHVAGNCYTERDEETGVMVHTYGPHIFHTDDKEVWDFVTDLTEFKPYVNRVKTTSQNSIYSLPINLHTINQYFGKTFNPSEAKQFIESIADTSIEDPQSFEEQAMRFVGKDFYEAFFKGYTLKQWGIHPKDLPASILKRLPVRFNYDDNYFNHKYQGMPVNGYNEIVEKLLDHENIEVKLNSPFTKDMGEEFDHVFFSGPLDSYFDYKIGRLGYRTLEFRKEVHEGDYQGTAVMNYGDENVPYTRITEHKYFSPWEEHEKTVIYKEYSHLCGVNDIPYYPIKFTSGNALFEEYVALAKKEPKVSFVGRLGTYQYMDMDVTIRKAMDAADAAVNCLEKGKLLPVFFES
ncbi:UDP-galactopyranose mutase [Vibrio sp. F13]|uniref:UDP-galactopyranose mutase n=1 Tax=Vibrio sp. F13 TaxID=2070777 RepID=UPI0010BD8E65|nr:UDP-galactopyranose mutase [Vibrio sp. F13]TKF67358.1 UDP-galactopyranose mutase [Vibrio sp. F13]